MLREQCLKNACKNGAFNGRSKVERQMPINSFFTFYSHNLFFSGTGMGANKMNFFILQIHIAQASFCKVLFLHLRERSLWVIFHKGTRQSKCDYFSLNIKIKTMILGNGCKIEWISKTKSNLYPRLYRIRSHVS